MKAIRISDKSYKFLKGLSEKEHRSLISTLDLFISVFEEHERELANEGVSPKSMGKQKTKD